MRRSQGGFSVIELMIAMLLGVILIGGLIQMFQGSKRTYRIDDAISRLQEDIRLVNYSLAVDVREAGFGCLDNVTNIVSTLNATNDLDFDFEHYIQGYDTATGFPDEIAADIVAATDLVVVRGTYDSQVSLETEMPDSSAVLKTTVMDPAPITTDDIVILTDCTNAAIFQVTNYTDANGNIVHNTGSGNPGNSSKSFGHSFAAGSQVIKVHSTTFYIGVASSGEPALMRRVNNRGDSEVTEIAEGVEDMQIQYGVNTDGVSGADTYVDASGVADWDDVMSVRFNLLMRSVEDKVVDSDQTLIFNGAEITWSDRYLRRVVSFVIAIRGVAE